MPIYEYRCDSCGFQKEFIQRMSDARLTDCPQCGKSTLNKMVTAAGFQLKGSGWYATDFRGGGTSSGDSSKKKDGEGSGDSASTASTTASDKPAGTDSKSGTDSKPAAAPAPSSTST